MLSRFRIQLCLVPLMLIGVFLIGCDPDYIEPGKYVEVQGKIYLDGSPVSNAKVFFVPELKERLENFSISFGLTNADGGFELETRNGQEGAIVGRHRVLVSKTTATAGEFVELGNATEQPIHSDPLSDQNSIWSTIEKEMGLKEGERIPFYYNVRTELTCDLIPGRGIHYVTFELSSTDPMLTRVGDSQTASD